MSTTCPCTGSLREAILAIAQRRNLVRLVGAAPLAGTPVNGHHSMMGTHICLCTRDRSKLNGAWIQLRRAARQRITPSDACEQAFCGLDSTPGTNQMVWMHLHTYGSLTCNLLVRSVTAAKLPLPQSPTADSTIAWPLIWSAPNTGSMHISSNSQICRHLNSVNFCPHT